nr:hypothetical protein Itr_chr06CG10440 [Ipomoea trifida]
MKVIAKFDELYLTFGLDGQRISPGNRDYPGAATKWLAVDLATDVAGSCVPASGQDAKQEARSSATVSGVTHLRTKKKKEKKG